MKHMNEKERTNMNLKTTSFYRDNIIFLRLKDNFISNGQYGLANDLIDLVYEARESMAKEIFEDWRSRHESKSIA